MPFSAASPSVSAGPYAASANAAVREVVPARAPRPVPVEGGRAKTFASDRGASSVASSPRHVARAFYASLLRSVPAPGLGSP